MGNSQHKSNSRPFTSEKEGLMKYTFENSRKKLDAPKILKMKAEIGKKIERDVNGPEDFMLLVKLNFKIVSSIALTFRYSVEAQEIRYFCVALKNSKALTSLTFNLKSFEDI